MRADVSSPPPPYSPALSPSNVSHVNQTPPKSLKQFLALHQLILKQEKELESVQCLLINASSPLLSALTQRRSDLISELQSVRVRRKQLSLDLLRQDSILSLPNRRRKLQSDIDILVSLLQHPSCDAEIARVLSSQLHWKRLKLQAVNQHFVRTDLQKCLEVVMQRPQTFVLATVAGVVMGKLGFGPIRRLCMGLGRLLWLVGRSLVGVVRPQLFLNLCVLMLLSRWLGKRSLLIVFLLLAFKFR